MSVVAVASDAWSDALLASELLAVDPAKLGGIVLRSPPGPNRDRVCAWIRSGLRRGSPWLKVPVHVSDDRLLGGLSLVDTLRAGRVVAERGLLAQADGGVITLAMAERLEARVTSAICATMDLAELSVERDGLMATHPCRLGVIALDEGVDDEAVPTALRDRLAFQVDLGALRSPDPSLELELKLDLRRCDAGRALLRDVVVLPESVDALCKAALALGIVSIRAPILAVAASRAHAALEGRSCVADADVIAAARLVLAPRALRLPVSDADDPEDTEPAPGPEDDSTEAEESAPAEPLASPPASAEEDSASKTIPDDKTLDEVVLEAAESAIPAGLLESLVMGRAPRVGAHSAGRSGALRTSGSRGRPAGTRAAAPRSGERLNVVETLHAAAPWQRLRQRERASGLADSTRLEVRKQDFRVTRFQQRMETTVIFSVDASGSAALQRLAEAKGAVEQVLADCYVRRDQVALVAFRSTSAAVLLPPTRSLARVKRRLADLAGGGATPLAAGIDSALALALEARKRGRSPLIVLMTDGRANVTREGHHNASVATTEALQSARAVRAAAVLTLFLDTAPRPRPNTRELATEMGARYLPLPYVDAVGISRHVRSLAGAGR